MTTLDAQHELALARAPQSVSVPVEIVRAKKTAAAAFTLACDCSGLEDKEIYLALEIDAGYFSRIKKGLAALDPNLTSRFCEIVGNRVYPEWQAFQIGCTLVQIQTEAERRAARAEGELVREREKTRMLMDLLAGRAAA